MSESNKFVFTVGQAHQLAMGIERNGGTTEDIQWLSAGTNFNAVKFLARGEAELILKPKSPAKEEIPLEEVYVLKLIGETNTQKQEGLLLPRAEYSFEVDYDLSFEELIERANCKINTWYKELRPFTFPNTGEGKRKVFFELIQFPQYAVHEDHVTKQFTDLKLRQTNLVEQLSFVAQLRKLHKAHQSITVVSLGSRALITETHKTIKKRWFRKDKIASHTAQKESCPSVDCGGTYNGLVRQASLGLSSCGKEMNTINAWKNHCLFLGAHI